ncbi:MAG: hypothetical protein IPK03_05675 [Bacteroidetes bacterium]|nr:hypothetical protein [Bacteroidota bacterium]
MRHFLRFFFALFLFSFHANAQNVNDTANFPYWWDMMHDRNINFFQTQRAFETYWSNKPAEARSHSGFKVFKRWEHHWKSRVNGDGSFRPADNDINEYRKFQQRNASRAANGAWTELGPRIMPTNSTGQPNGLGRINAIAFHPTNPNIYFIGAPQGGVWKTTNNGATWSISGTDNLPSLGASSIAIDPTNDQIMYLGTGDRDAGDAAGIGVYKSTNGGASWTVSNTGMGNREVNRITLNTLKNTTLLAASSDGVYKSYNSGATWVKKTSVNANYKELKMKPGDTAIWYTTEGSKFYRSANGGESWTQIPSTFGATITRMVIATCPSKPNMVYVVGCKSNGTYEGLYISDNAGLNFRLKSSTPNILGYLSDGSDAKGQGNYDLALSADYDDPKILYVGGINIFKSEDSGATWACVAHWTGANFIEKTHADQHIFEVNPLNKILHVGNDGGLYITTDQGSTWDDKTSGLGIAQIYRLGQNLLNPNSVITGYQDNGTAIYRSTWNTVIGGDGMECIIDHLDTTYQYGALYYGDVRRRSGAGFFNQIAGLDQSNNPVNGVTENGAWVTPYCLNPANTNTMIIGYKNIWRSTNVKASPPTWTRISSNGGGNITSCTFGNANNNHFYYWRNNNYIFRSTNINAATPTWDSVAIPGSGTVEDIETHPTDANRIWIVRGTKVYRSQDRGANWADITFALPGTSKNTIVMDKNSKEGLYVGTDAGVYYKDSTMAAWILYSTGLPVGSAINDLEIYYHPLNSNLSRISAATYGRGLWQSDLYSTQTQPIVNYYATDSVPCVGSTITLNDVSSPVCQNFQWTITPGTYTLMGATTLNSKIHK